jgi:IS30 family transposase
MGSKNDLTSVENNKIVKLLAEGLSIREIAKYLNRK